MHITATNKYYEGATANCVEENRSRSTGTLFDWYMGWIYANDILVCLTSMKFRK